MEREREKKERICPLLYRSIYWHVYRRNESSSRRVIIAPERNKTVQKKKSLSLQHTNTAQDGHGIHYKRVRLTTVHFTLILRTAAAAVSQRRVSDGFYLIFHFSVCLF